MEQIGNEAITVDLTVRDTIVEIDTIEVVTIIKPERKEQLSNGEWITILAETKVITKYDTTRTAVIPSANFIYHSNPTIEVDFAEAFAKVFKDCPNQGDNFIVMEQYQSYTLNFKVMEQMGNCPVQEGILRIYDFVSDRGTTSVDVPVKNGKAIYTIDAGVPNFNKEGKNAYKKLLYVMPRIGFLEDIPPLEYWITVTGVKPETPSFVTKTPELPTLILHDPPGDQSYVYVKEGTTFSNFITHELVNGGEGGVYGDMTFGKAGTVKMGVGIKFSATAGRDNFNRSGIYTSVTFDETFSTSSLEDFTGNDGDVYIGASYNWEYGSAPKLTFNEKDCAVKTEEAWYVNMTGFNTTFIYTEHHIKNTLLPTLNTLYNNIVGDKQPNELEIDKQEEAAQLKIQIDGWQDLLDENDRNRRESAVFEENISFSSGADYAKEYTSDSIKSTSYEYNVLVNAELAVGFRLECETGAWAELDIGAIGKFRYSNNVDTGTDSTFSRTVGYVLSDGDIGDYYSVDIKNDLVYGVPAFDLILGTTSCPWEPGSQKRDLAEINVYPPEINNVPIGGQALFYAQLTNHSESHETRSYIVGVDPTSNPDGALVRLGGHLINNNPATFTIDYDQTVTIALSVEKGPLASNYENIGLYIEPTCDLSSITFNEGGDYTSFNVSFQSECSNVALHLPCNNWLINKNSNNILNVAFTGYDLNNKYLEGITLQIRKEGEGWKDAFTVKREQIKDKFYDLAFDVATLANGNYYLRAAAWCGTYGGYTYSSEQKGKIDRNSIAPFGMPSPADGFLRNGQVISVIFDKNIDCDKLGKAIIRLYKEDGSEIPLTPQCSENKLILKPDLDLFLLTDLEGIPLTAEVSGIKDISGNEQDYTTIWSFLVNVSPVSWNPESIHRIAVESEKVVINANLNNSALQSKSFTVTEWPVWLKPSVTSASILSDNSFTVQLMVDESLKPGLYHGQVVAMVDDVPEVLNVTLELLAEDINWIVNHSDYEHNMNITAQFSSDDGDLNLSTGKYDKIGAYINGGLRGVGKIELVPDLNKYAAFINVSSNLAGHNGSLIEAEDYVDDKSLRDVSISDNGVNSMASRFRSGYWGDYDIYATKSGTFNVEFRVASGNNGNGITVLIDGIAAQSIAVPNTGNVDTYTTIRTTLTITEGSHKMRILSTSSEFYLNWINFPQYHVRNAHSDEVIKFRMWDGLNGIEYGAVEELTFFNDGVVGSAEQPFILHPSGRIQDFILSKGWNWISVNKQSNDMSVSKTFESLTPPSSLNELTFKSQTGYAQYAQSTGWMGTLTDVNLASGYMLYLSAHGDTLDLIGDFPTTDIQIPLNTKWNWIGYPKQENQPVDTVLSSLTSDNGDIIKGQTEFAEYNSGTNSWIGTLKLFEPGKGYKLFVSNPDNLNILKSGSPDDLYLKHEFNMTLTAVINFGDLPVSDNYQLRTIVNDQLRGEIPLTYVTSLDEYMAFTMIYGDRSDVGDAVKSVLWDANNQREYALSSPDISFGIDKINGTINNPVVLSVVDSQIAPLHDNQLNFNCYPNPFSTEIKFSYSLSSESKVSLMITDMFGKEIKCIVSANQASGDYNYVFDGRNLASGIYYSTIKTNKFVETRKLILLKQ
jgi:hypothetical protein